jgi:uncharacterized repeat protein (TIGR01451 family)
MALLPGSLAIDTADNAVCAAAPVNNFDQRGVTRPNGVNCDVGAYEAFTATLTVAGAGTGSGTMTGGPIACTSTAGVTSGTCSDSPGAVTAYVITATANVGSTFTGWSGCDSLTGLSGEVCHVSLSGPNRTVTATFARTATGGGGGGGSPITVGDPAVSKTGSPGSATVGETVVWTIVASNPGQSPSNPTTLTDNIPSQFDIQSATGTNGATTGVSGQTVTISIPALPPGGSATITITTIANSTALPGQICNTATNQAGVQYTGCVTILPANLPPTGGPSPLVAELVSLWPALIGLVGLLALGGWIMMRRGDLQSP